MLICAYSHDYFLLFWQNFDIFEQKSHDTRVILEHLKKNIGIYITLLSWSFFQKNCTITASILWCSNGFFDPIFEIFVKNNHDNGVILVLFIKTNSIKITLYRHPFFMEGLEYL